MVTCNKVVNRQESGRSQGGTDDLRRVVAFLDDVIEGRLSVPVLFERELRHPGRCLNVKRGEIFVVKPFLVGKREKR